jgi:hypothetical protein
MPQLFQGVVAGLIAGAVMAVVGVLVLPMIGLSSYAVPIIAGGVGGIVAPWATRSSSSRRVGRV